MIANPGSLFFLFALSKPEARRAARPFRFFRDVISIESTQTHLPQKVRSRRPLSTTFSSGGNAEHIPENNEGIDSAAAAEARNTAEKLPGYPTHLELLLAQ